MAFWPSIVVATPAHSGVGATLTYRSELSLAPGALVRVPLGSREVLGVVWDCPDAPPEGLTEARTKAVAGVLEGLPALNGCWRQLVKFSAQYYQRSLGEVALAALPPQLRELDSTQLARRLKRRAKAAAEVPPTAPEALQGHDLSAEQAEALQALAAATAPVLLYGATGSGKTEVYLRATQAVLEQGTPDSEAPTQVLVMVPEINLTPQLEARFRARFEPAFGAAAVVCLHSGMTPPQRLASWLAAHTGRARIVLGTRLAVFASLPGLRLIVVDEEHDPSYKAQDGARYSARDLAVYRGRLEGATVVLGSATPSLETGQRAQDGRYAHLACQPLAEIGFGQAAFGQRRYAGGVDQAGKLGQLRCQPFGAGVRVLAESFDEIVIERVERRGQSWPLRAPLRARDVKRGGAPERRVPGQQGLEVVEAGAKAHRPMKGVELAGGLILIIIRFVVIDDGIHARCRDIDRRLDHGRGHADRRCRHRHGRIGHGDDSAAVHAERAEQCEEK